MKLKLEIELVPESAWYSNLRKRMSECEWSKIGDKTRTDANYKCQICGSDGKNQIFVTRGSLKGTLNCHEIWEYDDKKHIQKLKGFIALCNDCHMIKHIGFAGIQASKGLLDMDKLIKHFMVVNQVGKKTFENHKDNSFTVWSERSKHEWTADLSKLPALMQK